MKVDLSVATETTAELERLVQDTAPAAIDSKSVYGPSKCYFKSRTDMCVTVANLR